MKTGVVGCWAVVVLLSGCGGGGGGSGKPPAPPASAIHQSSISSNSVPQSSMSSSSSSSLLSVDIQPITRANTPLLAGALVDVIGLAKSIPDDLSSTLMDISLLGDGRYTSVCDNAGSSYTATVSDKNKKIIETFDRCIIDGTHFSGSRSVEIVNDENSSEAKALFSWANFNVYEVSAPGDAETINGNVYYEGKALGYTDSDNRFLTRFNLEISSIIEGVLIVKEGIFTLTYPPMVEGGYEYYFSDAQEMSGDFSFSGVGAAHFSAVAQSRNITLTGMNGSQAFINPAPDFLQLSLDEDGDGAREVNVNVSPYVFGFGSSFSDAIKNSEARITLRNGISHPVFEWQGLMMGRGNSLQVDISNLFLHSSVDLLDYTLQVNGNVEAVDMWSQSDAGVFNLFFSNNMVDETYKLIFIVSDQLGNHYELPVDLFVGADFDGDNIPDEKDFDDDNDGLNDHADAFPFDPIDSEDLDKDGIGDNRDEDIDNDGVPNLDDAYPRDANCSLLTAGDGEQCYSSYSTDFWFMDTSGVVYSNAYVKHTSNNSVYLFNRFDAVSGEFLAPVELSGANTTFFSDKNQKIYSSNRQTLRVTDLATGITSTIIENLGLFSIHYIEQNHIVIARMLSPASESEIVESYNMSGQLISSVQRYQNGNRTVVIQPKLAHFCNSYISTNQNGVFEVKQSSPSVSDNCHSGMGSLEYSPDESRYFSNVSSLGDSAIYKADHSLLFGVDVSNITPWFWTRSGFVVVTVDPVTWEKNNFTLYDPNGVSSVKFSYPQDEVHVSVVSNGEIVVLATRVLLTKKIRVRTFDKDLNLLSVKDY